MAITDKLKNIADAIRGKLGTEDLMQLDQMPELIDEISGDALPDYEGEYVVTPSFEQKILNTDERSVRENITIEPISVSEVSNPSNGKTLII